MPKNEINILIFPIIIALSVFGTIMLNDRTLKPIEDRIISIEKLVILLIIVLVVGGVYFGRSIIF